METDQAPYHLFRRDIEDDVLPYCEREGMGVIVYGALAHGLLTGAMNADTGFEVDDWRSKSNDFRGRTFATNLAVVERLKALARERGVSLPQLAIAWTLAHPAVDVALVGARQPSHLDESVAAADVKLEDDDVATITKIVADGMTVRGPSPEGM